MAKTQVSNVVVSLLVYLQLTLDEWSAHVSRLRNCYPTLNFFTTDQLVILSAQLAKLIYANLPVTPQAAILLNLVGPNLSQLTHEELADFAKAAMVEEQVTEVVDADMDVEEAVSDSDMSTDDDTDDEDEPDEPFQDLKSHSAYPKLLEDYEQNLVLASIITCDTDNIDALMDWCFDHSDEKNPGESAPKTFNQAIRSLLHGAPFFPPTKVRGLRPPERRGTGNTFGGHELEHLFYAPMQRQTTRVMRS